MALETPIPKIGEGKSAPGSDLLLLGVFLAGALLLYGRVLDAFFVADDFFLLRAVRDGGPWGLWFRGETFLRPLIGWSLFLEMKLWGLSPLGFHLTNVLVHGFNSFWVFLIARDLPCPGDEPVSSGNVSNRRAAAAGAFFLVLPCHGEAVAWISGRTDVFAAFFGLLSIWAYLRFRGSANPAHLGLSLLAFGGALSAKESVVTLPLILGLYELFYGRRDGTRPRASLAPTAHFGLLAVYLAVRARVLSVSTSAHFRVEPAAAIENVILHGIKTLTAHWPEAALGLRPFLKAHKWETAAIFCLVTVTVALLGIYRLRRLPADARWRSVKEPAFLVLAWGTALLPVVPLSTRLFTSESDRFLYFPSVFACWLLVAGLLSLFRRRAAWTGLAVLWLIYGGLLQRAVGNWQAAGEMSRGILESLEDVEAEHVEILALPDNLSGAYIFRNGFQAALDLFPSDERPRSARSLTTYEIFDPGDGPEIVVRPEGVSLRLVDPRASFYSPASLAAGCSHVLWGEGPPYRHLEVSLTGCDAEIPALLFAEGRLREIPGRSGGAG